MNKKRLSLNELKVKSFVTHMDKKQVYGGSKGGKSEIDPGKPSIPPTGVSCFMCGQ